MALSTRLRVVDRSQTVLNAFLFIKHFLRFIKRALTYKAVGLVKEPRWGFGWSGTGRTRQKEHQCQRCRTH